MESTVATRDSLRAHKAPQSDFLYFANIVWALAVSEFKLRYFGSVLGYAWTLARPLMLFGVLYVVFTKIVRFGSGIPNYPLVILTGIVMWTFFADSTTGAISSLVNRDNLIRKMSFPLAAIPVSQVLVAAFNLGLNLIAVFVFYAISGILPDVNWFYLPLILMGLLVFAIPVSILLSVLYVRFRDMKHIWEVVLQAGFWGSPIIWTIEKVPEPWPRYVMFNPIAVILEETRHYLIDHNAPTASEAMGGTVWLLVPAAIVAAIAVAAYIMFRRESKDIAELL